MQTFAKEPTIGPEGEDEREDDDLVGPHGRLPRGRPREREREDSEETGGRETEADPEGDGSVGDLEVGARRRGMTTARNAIWARRTGIGAPSIRASQPGSQLRVRTRRDGVEAVVAISAFSGSSDRNRAAAQDPEGGAAGAWFASGEARDEGDLPRVEARPAESLEDLVVGRDAALERQEGAAERSRYSVAADAVPSPARGAVPGSGPGTG